MDAPEEAISTYKLRKQLRKYCEDQRAEKRKCGADSLRLGLGDIQSVISENENLTVKDVLEICVELKKKRHASKENMFRLNHAFLQSQENITAFINNTGALSIIVKELTAHDAEKQVMAAEMLCNLSLGDVISCEKIALAAGSYLVTYLDSTDERLKATSLWIITNIIATNGKGLKVLMSLEIVSKLLHLWNTEKCEATLRDIVTALDLLVCSDLLRSEDRDNLRRGIFAKRPGTAFDEYRLKIVFESIKKNINLTENEIIYFVNFCVYNLVHVNKFLTNSDILRVVYSLRIISNLISLYPVAAGILVESARSLNLRISDILNSLLENGIVVQEVLWCARNLTSCQRSEMQIYLQENNFLGELKVGRFSVAKYF